MTTRLILGCRSRLIAAGARLRTDRKAAAGRNFLPAPTTVQARAAAQITVLQLITIRVLEFPLLTALTMHRRATLAETAGLRLICIGLLSRPENSRVIHRPRSGASPATIRLRNTMSLATIRLPHGVILVARTQDRARDRTTAVAAHRAAAAAVDRHLTGIMEAHRLTAAAIANPIRTPAHITVSGASKNITAQACSFYRHVTNKNRFTCPDETSPQARLT
jgi:hypothetical protein